MSDTGWTLDTLNVHLSSLIAASDRRAEERGAAQDKAVDAALAAAKEAVNAALIAADRAVAKAEIAAGDRFEAVNGFRDQLADQTATFITRVETEARLAALGDRLETALKNQSALLGSLADRTGAIEGRTTGLNAGWGYVCGALGIFIAVGSIAVGAFT